MVYGLSQTHLLKPNPIGLVEEVNSVSLSDV